MPSVTEVLRNAKSYVASQQLHQAFACFCHAKEILSSVDGKQEAGPAAPRVLRNVNMEVQRMSAYLRQDPYAALGLNSASSLSLNDVKKAYRQLARTYHPDKNQYTDQLFIIIKDAYEKLSDPSHSSYQKRSRSNESRHNPASNPSNTSATESNFEARRKKRQAEAAAMAAAKRRNMEMRRRREAALRRQREAKLNAERKHREEIMQKQMREQLKRAWQYVHQQQQSGAESNFDKSQTHSEAPKGFGDTGAPSIAAKLASIQSRVMEKMNEIRRKSLERENSRLKKDARKTTEERTPGKKGTTEEFKTSKKNIAKNQKVQEEHSRETQAGGTKAKASSIPSTYSSSPSFSHENAERTKHSVDDGIRVRAEKPKAVEHYSDTGIRVGPKDISSSNDDGIRVQSVPQSNFHTDDGIRVRAATDKNFTTTTTTMEFPDESNESIGSFFSNTMGMKVKLNQYSAPGSKGKQDVQNKSPKLDFRKDEAKAPPSKVNSDKTKDLATNKNKVQLNSAESKSNLTDNLSSSKSTKVSSLRSKVQESRKKEAATKRNIHSVTSKSDRRVPGKTASTKSTLSTSLPSGDGDIKASAPTGPTFREKLSPKSANDTEDRGKKAKLCVKNNTKKTAKPTIDHEVSSLEAKKIATSKKQKPKIKPRKQQQRKRKVSKKQQATNGMAKEQSFVEQVRDMWRSAVLETVGLGTDAAFLRKIGIDQDEDANVIPQIKTSPRVGPESDDIFPVTNLNLDTAERAESIPESISTTKKSKMLPVREVSKAPLPSVQPLNSARGNPSVFTSNPEKFPCKRCGQYIDVDNIIKHANSCKASEAATEVVGHDFESKANPSRVDTSDEQEDMPSNGFVCQLCNLMVCDKDMATHPATCPGLNPKGAGMFWGTSIPVQENARAVSIDGTKTKQYRKNGEESVFLDDDRLDGGGAVYLGEVDDDFNRHFGDFSSDDNIDDDDDGYGFEDDGDDDEPLIGGDDDGISAVDGGMDFFGFSKQWQESIEGHRGASEVEGLSPGGFFSATGVFHMDGSSSIKKSYRNAGIAETESKFSDESSEFSDESSEFSDDAEPMIGGESHFSELERALQQGGKEPLLVFA